MSALRHRTKSISVLMAALNAESTIETAVKSALFALSQFDELLVFLDGCTDGTKSVVDKIQDPRLRVFSSLTSKGRSEARNQLSLEAQGDYIAILDADDVCLPWRFTITRRLLKKFDVVFGAAILFGDLPLRLPFAITFPTAIGPEIAPLVLTYRNPSIHSTAIFRRDAVVPGYLYEDAVAEEYVLWIKMANQGLKLYRSRMPIAAYRLHSQQLTSSKSYVKRVQSCPTLEKHRSILRESQLSKLEQRRPNTSTPAEILAQHAQNISRALWLEENLTQLIRAIFPWLKKGLDTWR